jgi:FMN-dependent oxidoreductase (nitrilotriacetate monooxygenase family)
MRQMILVGFLQAQNCTNLPSSWRHPESRLDFTSPAFYQKIGQVLEAGKFHLAFFDDRLTMPDLYGADYRHTVQHGIRCVKLDPVATMMALGFGTSRLGVGATNSTTYYQPYHVARLFQTVDHMLGGRAAWNVVTSVNDGEARNMGQRLHLAHEERYDRADEFVEIVLRSWDGWEDDAIECNRETGRFADPDKVHRTQFEGRYLRSEGTFTVPRSPQGHPVLIQAGSSPRGRRFGARWADTVFVDYHSKAMGRQRYAEFKADVARHGRNPDHVPVNILFYPIVGATRAEAEDRMAAIERQYVQDDGLSLLSEAMNFDFARKGLDEAFTSEELEGMTGMQEMRDNVMRSVGRNPTVRDFLEVTRRGRPRDPIVGSPKDIADRMEEWFTDRATDGFVISAPYVPGAYEDFVRLVVPELQRRGLYHTDYSGATLRENLGLPRPEIGAWQSKAGHDEVIR